ncbi:4Fe-4S dicluster domain-containing protein [Aromatoleum toluclasticum]|uniref:ethylbenzene dehydrogenase subunit beta n=1 Tax=Aromatoleum toluclasticum TaxID=92003 RepID=UPI00037D4799|nr:ethylbenzene dehydrogenase subunit beta [Aromatoleum toluclasticum]MCC4116693.1 4Fe-4S dicluster domain-containing protein [Aromatoleum toluclasticum]
MAYVPGGSKKELRKADRQLATVIDLNKCLGCQTCSVACKNLWTKRPGTEHMRWANVTTYPGKGYPRDYEKKGGGFRDGEPQPGKIPSVIDSGDNFQFNHNEVYYEGKGQSVRLHPVSNVTGKEPEWGYNWDEDQGGGQWPNPYFFYFARMCNHCTKPACLEACPTGAIFKREKDGIVLIDQDRCKGHRHCVEACPYKAVYFNPVAQKSEKCILCFPRIDKGIANACNRQCTGRVRAFGYLDDRDSQVHKLVAKWKVALPLHAEYGTGPNVFYVPPMGARGFGSDGEITDGSRIPLDVLEGLFGPEVRRVLDVLRTERAKMKAGQGSELMDILISKKWTDRFGGFTNDPLTQS